MVSLLAFYSNDLRLNYIDVKCFNVVKLFENNSIND